MGEKKEALAENYRYSTAVILEALPVQSFVFSKDFTHTVWCVVVVVWVSDYVLQCWRVSSYDTLQDNEDYTACSNHFQLRISRVRTVTVVAVLRYCSRLVAVRHSY